MVPKDSTPPARKNTATGLKITNAHEQLQKSLPLIVNEDDQGDGDGEEEEEESTAITQRLDRGPRAPRSPDVESSEPLPAGVKASLDILSGPQVGRSFEFSGVATAVGRSCKNVSIDDPTISRVHAFFVYRATEFRVRDAGSANGVYLNGARVTDYALRDGDELLLGQTHFLFSFSSRR
jgi:hypothetical protein